MNIAMAKYRVAHIPEARMILQPGKEVPSESASALRQKQSFTEKPSHSLTRVHGIDGYEMM